MVELLVTRVSEPSKLELGKGMKCLMRFPMEDEKMVESHEESDGGSSTGVERSIDTYRFLHNSRCLKVGSVNPAYCPAAFRGKDLRPSAGIMSRRLPRRT
jgi:hypothetical protein